MKDIIDMCPNCEDPNDEIKPMEDVSCGVCAGKGTIVWNCIGKLVDLNN